MNIYAVIVAILVCATVIGAIYLLIKKPICIKIIHKEEKEIVSPVQLTTADSETKPESEPEKDENEPITDPKNMDAVIASVNELMGIQTSEDR